MKHDIWLDEETRALYIRFTGYLKSGDVEEISRRCRNLMNGDSRRNAFMDLSNIESFPDQEVRDQLTREIQKIGLSRVAVIGSRPEVKVIGVILVRQLSDYVETQFFHTRKEALSWLTSPKKEGG